MRLTGTLFKGLASVGIILAFAMRVVGAGPPAAPSVPDQNPDAAELLRMVVYSQVHAFWNDHSLWMYRRVTGTSGKRKTIEFIETKEGDLDRLVSVNGRPLTAKQQKQQDRRARNMVAHPAEARNLQRKEQHDRDNTEYLVSLLPKAIIVSYGERKGEMVELNFKPNPRFRPHTREAAVFRAMIGTIWVNTKQKRLTQVDGGLDKSVPFGSGFLGHLNRGGQLHIAVSEVKPDVWKITKLQIHITGKALFFDTIHVYKDETQNHFVELPTDLTLARATEKVDQQTYAVKTK